MARRYIFTNSLSAGEVAPEYLMRTDSQARNEGAKTFRNALLLAGGGFRRRWGTVDLAALPGDCRLETRGVGADDAQILAFSSGRFEVRDLDGVLIQAVTGCPWTGDDLATMQVAIENDRIVVTSRSFFPQALTLDSITDLWSLADLPFTEGINGASLQPYWRYAPKGVSLTPSAYTGAITLITDEDFFLAAHVGARIRYTGVEITITAVTDAQHASGTVVGTLYTTVTVTVASSTGFLIGQVVQGEDTQILATVTAIPDGTHVQCQLLEGYTFFDATEKLVGPTAKSQISAIVAAGSPAATVEWDEAMISDARGFPGACALHRSRLLLGDFPQAQNAMAASTPGDISDFDVGTGLDDDAVIERVGREASLGLKHFGSTEQLLMFTQAGPYYVPEQVAAPFSPTNFEILNIGPEKVADPEPLQVSEGMLFVEQDSGRVMIAQPTGNVRRSWEIGDLSELGFHLMGTPVEIELLPAGSETDRLVLALRDDGQIAVLTYRRGTQVAAWGLWTTTGSWRSLVTAAGVLYAVAERVIAGVTVFRLERFDPAAWADGMVDLATLATPALLYASSSVGVWDDDYKVGTYALNGSGVLQGVDSSYTAVQIGLDYTMTVAVVPPIDPNTGLRQKIRICRVDVDVLDSVGFRINGYDPSGWEGAVGGAVITNTGVRRFRTLGRSKDATVTLVQDVGGPCEVRSITMEVTS